MPKRQEAGSHFCPPLLCLFFSPGRDCGPSAVLPCVQVMRYPLSEKDGAPSERACRCALPTHLQESPVASGMPSATPLQVSCSGLLHLRFWPIIQRCNILCSYSHGFSLPSWQSDTGAAICNPDALSAGPLRSGTSAAAPQCRCGALCVRPHIPRKVHHESHTPLSLVLPAGGHRL